MITYTDPEKKNARPKIQNSVQNKQMVKKTNEQTIRNGIRMFHLNIYVSIPNIQQRQQTLFGALNKQDDFE